MRAVDSTSANDGARIREVTLKSFSPTRHIRHPGFQLLSIIPPQAVDTSTNHTTPTNTYSDTLCLFPDQSVFYFSMYPMFILLTAFVVLVYNYRASPPLRINAKPSPIPLVSHPSPSAEAMGTPYNPNYPGTPVPQSAASDFSQFAPFSPTSPTAPPRSPYSALPPGMRTPSGDNLAAPHLRAMNHSPTPRAHTPQSSTLLSPTSVFMRQGEDEADHDAEDAMYPSQYISQTSNGNGTVPRSLGSPSKYDREPDSYFLPAPAVKRDRGLAWTWTFVFRGRRRRMTIKVPRFLGGGGSGSGGGLSAGPRRSTGEILIGSAKDFGMVMWPAVSLWLFTVWWTL